MSENKNSFNYTYSASQQQEIKKIREKYAPPTREEDNMEKLRRLDASAAKPGTIVSLIVGIIGTLLLGVEMCCTMVWSENLFIPGIIIGVIGIACVIASYPIYNALTKKQREKIAPEIMRITDELMK